MQKFSVKVLRLKLEEFLRPHIASINFDDVDLMTTLDGLPQHYLPRTPPPSPGLEASFFALLFILF